VRAGCRRSTRDAPCRVYGYNGQFDLGDENANNNLFWTLNGEIVYAKSPAFPAAPLPWSICVTNLLAGTTLPECVLS
jgi:hypothetical protein